jgi:hypothetical protein
LILLQHAFQLHRYLLLLCIKLKGPTIKVWLALIIHVPFDQPGFMLMLGRPCLVAQLGIMVVLMNNKC